MDKNFDIIIIGAGPAGLSAAIYAARAGKSVLVLEQGGFGGQIVYSPKVENYPGIKNISGNEFAETLVDQALSLGVSMEMETVVSIENSLPAKTIVTDCGSYTCFAIIVATGVKHRTLGVDGEDRLSGSGVSYCAVCDGAFFKGKAVAVIGGGNTALQDSMYLSSICRRVTVIHRRSSFRGEQYLLDQLKKRENVDFCLNSVISSLNGSSELESVSVKDSDGKIKNLDISGLFIAIGQTPNNDLFSSVFDLDESGYVIAGEDCKTSADGIWAAGDCRVKNVRQLTTASADGAISGLAACEYINKL